MSALFTMCQSVAAASVISMGTGHVVSTPAGGETVNVIWAGEAVTTIDVMTERLPVIMVTSVIDAGVSPPARRDLSGIRGKYKDRLSSSEEFLLARRRDG